MGAEDILAAAAVVCGECGETLGTTHAYLANHACLPRIRARLNDIERRLDDIDQRLGYIERELP